MSSTKEKMNRAYIENKLSGILEPMVSTIFKENPEDHIEFMIKYLKENYGNRHSVNMNDRLELNFLRQELSKVKDKEEKEDKDEDEGSERGSEASEDDDYVDDLTEEELKKN